MDRRVSCICHLNCLIEFACSTILNWDNCITALILSSNCLFALIFSTLHVCPWFLKSKAPLAPVSQHRELDLNNNPKKIHKKQGKKTILPLIQITQTPPLPFSSVSFVTPCSHAPALGLGAAGVVVLGAAGRRVRGRGGPSGG